MMSVKACMSRALNRAFTTFSLKKLSILNFIDVITFFFTQIPIERVKNKGRFPQYYVKGKYVNTLQSMRNHYPFRATTTGKKIERINMKARIG